MDLCNVATSIEPEFIVAPLSYVVRCLKCLTSSHNLLVKSVVDTLICPRPENSFALPKHKKYPYIMWHLQSPHNGSDVQVEFNVEHHHEADIVPKMTRSPRVKYITYYEDSESIPGRRTAVWELDKGMSLVM